MNNRSLKNLSEPELSEYIKTKLTAALSGKSSNESLNENEKMLVDDAIKKAIATIGKDIVLVHGECGVGKSTLVNYLLGYKIEKFPYENIHTRFDIENSESTNLSNDKTAKIGHSFKPATLFAESFTTDDGISLCDTPALLGIPFYSEKGDFDECEKLHEFERLTVRFAVELANSIKGIIMVMSVMDMFMHGGEKYHYMNVRSLFNLVKNHDDLPRSVITVFTKNDLLAEDAREIFQPEYIQKEVVASRLHPKRMQKRPYEFEVLDLISKSAAVINCSYDDDASRLQIIETIHKMQHPIDQKYITCNDSHQLDMAYKPPTSPSIAASGIFSGPVLAGRGQQADEKFPASLRI